MAIYKIIVELPSVQKLLLSYFPYYLKSKEKVKKKIRRSKE